METGAQQLSEWVRIPLCPELSADPVPWAVTEPQGCSPCSVPGQGCHCWCQATQTHWNSVSARPARLHGLKLSQTLLAGHLNRATWSSHQSPPACLVHFRTDAMMHFMTNDHGDKVSLTLTHFCCVSYTDWDFGFTITEACCLWCSQGPLQSVTQKAAFENKATCIFGEGWQHSETRGQHTIPWKGSLHSTSEVS